MEKLELDGRRAGGILCCLTLVVFASCTSGGAGPELGAAASAGLGAFSGSVTAAGAAHANGGATQVSAGATSTAGGNAGTSNGNAGSGSAASAAGASAAGAGGSGGAASSSGGFGAAGTSGTAGNSGTATGACVNPPAALQGGSNAWASRYWDCCKPACGWKGNVKSGNPMKSCDVNNNPLGSFDTSNACQSGGSAFMCWSDSPWTVCDGLSYGFAAASAGNYVCGRCFQLQFDGGTHNAGDNAGAKSLKGKTMIVQVINNGGVASDQFDLLIPGGGVGLLNACSSTTAGITSQWGKSLDLGAQYGGLLAGCNGDKSCVAQKCQAVFAGKPDLQQGCDWFLGWFNAADNPTFTFKRVACPAAITQKSGLSDPG